MNQSPFRFRLHSVLRVARAAEDDGQRLLAAAAAAERDAGAREDACAEAYASCVEAPGDYRAVAVDDFKARAAAASHRAEALRLAQADRHAAGHRTAAVRDEVLARVVRRRSLEELESRHRAEHAVNAGRAAQKALDELAHTRVRAR